LVHTGRYCTIDSALLVIQKSDQTTTRKKIDRDRIIKVEDTSGDSIGVEFRTGQQLNGVEYVMFDIKSSSDAEPADPPGAFTISQSGYKDYQGYGFKVEYLTHGTRCEIDGGDLEIRKPDGSVLQDYIPVEGRIIVDDYSITCMDAYSAEGVSYMKIHVEPAEINCTDTDGGIDINMRGVCSDYSGSYVDECFNDSFIREYFCDGRVCRGRLLGCFEGDCVDGACCGLETDELSDLVVVDARFSPANPKVGDILMVYVTVRNQGLEESPQTWVRVIEQRGWYNAAKVSALPPGGEDFRVIQLHVHDVHATYNPHHFDIEVDYLNRVHESDENNNILERELTVSEVDIALNCSQYCAVYGYDYGVCKTECGLAEKVFMGRYCQHKTDMCCCGTLQPPTPPAPPNRIMKQLDGGWNLVALSGYGGIDKGSCLNIYGFVYFEGDLYTIQDLEDKLGSRGLKNYLRTHAFWVYSPTRCQMEFLLDEYSSYGEISLLGGWNFIPVTEDMVSRSLEEFRGDCVFLGGFMWDAVKQGWVELSDEYRFDEGDVFTGFVWYAGGGCNLGGVVEPTTTTLVGGWT